jgi:hypothetical protein
VGQIAPYTEDPIVNDEFLYDVVSGLAGDNTISFRSVEYPDRHFIAKQKALSLDWGNDQDFRDGASFRLKNGFYGQGSVSYESVVYPGHYIVHENYKLVLRLWDGTPAFNQKASWNPHI